MSDAQSYATHAHRPVLWTVGLACWLVASAGAIAALFDQRWAGLALTVGLISVTGVLLAIGRVYVTRLQDRIILLEMQVRGARLLSPGQQAQLAALSKAQVVALRFASDGELPTLLDRAAAEGLPPDAIKRAIVHWRADRLRT